MSLSPPQERDFSIGLARLKDHLLNHAELLFLRVLASAPDHPGAQRFLGITLFKMGRRDEALDLLRRASALDAAASADLDAALHGGAFSTDHGEHAFRVVDYGYRSSVRYGAGRPQHPQLAALIGEGRERYAQVLAAIGAMREDFALVPLGGVPSDPAPFWLNPWFPPLDGMALTHMLRSGDPARFIEIGSGVSTKFARRAVSFYGLRTQLTSIDPQPRNEIDALCDQVLRQPLEDCPLSVFEALEPGDILFLDSSHRSFQGSDVTAFFLDILPRVKPGVVIHIHDIYLPEDYISGHVGRLWNEQYLLATALLFGGQAFEILFPCWYVGQDPELFALAKAPFKGGPLENLHPYGASFWLRKT